MNLVKVSACFTHTFCPFGVFHVYDESFSLFFLWVDLNSFKG